MQSGEFTAATVRRQSILGSRLLELKYKTENIPLLDVPLGGLVMSIAEGADPTPKKTG